MNKFENVWEGRGPCTVISKLNKFEPVWGNGALHSSQGSVQTRGKGLGPCTEVGGQDQGLVQVSPCEHNDTHTRLKTLPSPLRWRTVINSFYLDINVYLGRYRSSW